MSKNIFIINKLINILMIFSDFLISCLSPIFKCWNYLGNIECFEDNTIQSDSKSYINNDNSF